MSKRFLTTLLAVCVAAGVALAAQSPFIGDWKLDASRSRTPDEMKVESKGGDTYVFDFGGGPETIVADGTDQKGLQGSLLSVERQAADTWIVKRKLDGRLMLRATWKLSADGRTLTDYYREFETDGSTTSLDYVYERTGAGGSGFAADWQSVKETNNATVLMQVKAFEGDGMLGIIVQPAPQTILNLRATVRASQAGDPRRSLSACRRRVSRLGLFGSHSGKSASARIASALAMCFSTALTLIPSRSAICA